MKEADPRWYLKKWADWAYQGEQGELREEYSEEAFEGEEEETDLNCVDLLVDYVYG